VTVAQDNPNLSAPKVRTARDRPHRWNDGDCGKDRCAAPFQHQRWPVCTACGLCWWDAPERCTEYQEEAA
jgi:hypothetical protein